MSHMTSGVDTTSCQLLEDKNSNRHMAPIMVSARPPLLSNPLASGSLMTSNGKLNWDLLVASGMKVKEESRKRFNLEVNHTLVQLICVCGLVPNILDSLQWENFVTKLGGGQYKHTRSDEFHNKFISQEAVYVCDLQLKLLKSEENLTLTF